MSSEVIGDTGELKDQTVDFNAIHKVEGVSGVGQFILSGAIGLSQYINGHAQVVLLENSLRLSIRGPVNATVACTVDACVIPSTFVAKPDTAEAIQTVQGNASAQHSLLVGVQDSPIKFANGVSYTLKPASLVGDPPRVCYSYHINGGTSASVAYIKISGTIRATGIGFRRTW